MCGEKSAQGCRSVLRTRDHPRACGEKKETMKNSPDYMGSPPRMRGKVDALSDIIQDYGITPACAGKSVRRENSSS